MRERAARLVTVARSLALPLVLPLILAGCGAAEDFFGRRDSATEQPLIVEETELSGYLRLMGELAKPDPVAQSEAYAEVADAYQRAPTTTNRLRLALAQSIPGHPGSDMRNARSMLSDLLVEPELLLGAEKLLAEVQLRNIEEFLTLTGANERLAARAASADNARNSTLERRVAVLQAENRRLEGALAEAEEKLRAIASIERSIRERADDETQPQR